ncbi:histidine phosphatase family protein [Methylophaga sp.]|uniref:histidine phosphatase family protein n=1 Tax=Methylophaga sp. TaxID=2024840 RepID=UPI003A8DFF5A
MSDVLLLRHAKSDWSLDVDDFDRPLNNRGKRAAQRMGEWLNTHQLIPEQVWVSAAKRTMETAGKTLKAAGLPISLIKPIPELYEASPATVLDIIAKAQKNVGLTLIIGHNPGMEIALVELVADQLPDFGDDKVLPTATLAHLHFDDNKVSLNAFIRPKNLPKKFPVRRDGQVHYCDRPAYYYQQSGVLAYRWHNEQLQVLLVSKQDREKWGIPKGIIEPGLSATESASKEAMEEAGVIGNIHEDALGCFQHNKWGGICEVKVYPMRVTELADDTQWESEKRRRQWFVVDSAARVINKPDLVDMIRALTACIQKQA